MADNKPKTFAEAVIATKPKLVTDTPQQVIDTKSILAQLEARTGIKLSVNAQSIASGDTLFNSFSNSQKRVINNIMGKLGHKSSSIEDLKTNLEAYYPELYNSAKSFADLNAKLLADYLPTDSAAKENFPQRSIPSYDQNAIKSWIDGIYEKNLGRKATAQELQDRFDEVKPLLEYGTLTTTSKKYNPATGKTEIVTKTDTGFNQAAEEKTIEEKLKLLNPDDYDRQQRIGFADWLSKNVQGA